MKSLAPSVTTRDPKGQKFISIVAVAYNKAGLSDEEAQNVNDTAGLSALVSKFIADVRKDRVLVDRMAIYMMSKDNMEGAEALAEAAGYPFDREIAFKIVEDIYGKKEADAMRAFYSPEAEARFEAAFEKGIKEGLRRLDEKRAREGSKKS